MKVLLIGFSEQNSEVLKMFMSRQHPTVETVVIDRAFDDNLRFSLPALTAHRDAKAMIVSLEGVGMMSYSVPSAKALQGFVGVRAGLFMTKAETKSWQNAKLFPEDLGVFLQLPYSKQQLELAISELVLGAELSKARASEFYQSQPIAFDAIAAQSTKSDNHSQKTSHPLNHNQNDNHNQNLNQTKNQDAPSPLWQSQNEQNNTIQNSTPSSAITSEQEVYNQALVQKMFAHHFTGRQETLFLAMLEMAFSKTPLKIGAGSQTLYLSPSRHLAMVANKQRLLDYCAMINKFETVSQVFDVAPMGEALFARAEAQLGEDKRYHAKGLFWQMYDLMLPDNIVLDDASLNIQSLPNQYENQTYEDTFAALGLPPQARQVLSQCALYPMSVAELYDVLALDKQVINKTVLLALILGLAKSMPAPTDIITLTNPIKPKTEPKIEPKDAIVSKPAAGEDDEPSTKQPKFVDKLIKILNTEIKFPK